MLRSYFAVAMRVRSLAALPAFLFAADGSATARASHARSHRSDEREARMPASGLRYSFTTRSSTSGDGGERDQLMLAGTAAVLGANARLDVSDAASLFLLKKGNYVLVKGEAATLTIVDAAARNYYELSASDIGQGMAAFAGPAGKLVSIQVSGIETRGETIGAGPSLSGYATTQYRVSQRYTMKMSMFGKKSTVQSSTTIDYFLAPSVTKELVYPFADLGNAIAKSLPGGNGLGELARQLLAEQRTLFTGTPLRTLTRTESVDEKGRRSVSTYTNEITNIERVPIDPSIFVIPAAYTEAPSPVAIRGSGSSGASATANGQAAQGTRDGPGFPGQVGDAAKDGATQGVRDGVRESAREAVTKKVRGLFRKP